MNTLRSVVDDDAKWFSLIKGFFQTYKYQDILTEDVIGYFNKETGKDLTAIFNEYLRHAPLPVLELKWEAGKVQYRWRAEEAGFAMPVRVGKSGAWLLVTPGAEWKEMETSLSKDDFKVDVDHYYVGVEWK